MPSQKQNSKHQSQSQSQTQKVVVNLVQPPKPKRKRKKPTQSADDSTMQAMQQLPAQPPPTAVFPQVQFIQNPNPNVPVPDYFQTALTNIQSATDAMRENLSSQFNDLKHYLSSYSGVDPEQSAQAQQVLDALGSQLGFSSPNETPNFMTTPPQTPFQQTNDDDNGQLSPALSTPSPFMNYETYQPSSAFKENVNGMFTPNLNDTEASPMQDSFPSTHDTKLISTDDIEEIKPSSQDMSTSTHDTKESSIPKFEKMLLSFHKNYNKFINATDDKEKKKAYMKIKKLGDKLEVNPRGQGVTDERYIAKVKRAIAKDYPDFAV